MRGPGCTFAQFYVKDGQAWLDEDANQAFFRVETDTRDWKRYGGSPHRLFRRRLRLHVERMERAFERKYGHEINPGRRIQFVVLRRGRVAMAFDDIWICFFKLRSEVARVEKNVMMRGMMES